MTSSDREARRAKLAGVDSWLYQLQRVDPAAVRASDFDLLVTDYSRDGAAEGEWTRSEVAMFRSGPRGPRPALAYLSIGEAEDYRYYWRSDWRPGSPPWLDAENLDWPGNYKTQFWDPDWQWIIFGAPGSYLDRIIAAGFDGVYLDIVDAYEYYAERGRETAAQEMVEFVSGIARYARVALSRPDFLIFPQNGEALIAMPGYLDVIDGIGREDTFFDGDAPVAPEIVAETVERLDAVVAGGRIVLAVDYVRRPENIAAFYRLARARGYVPYATVRALDQLVVNPGFEP